MGWLDLALFIFCALSRLLSFAVPFFSDDEAAYAAMADILLHGGQYYRDAVDHKPPLTVWLYSWVFWIFGESNMFALHLMLILWVFATAWVLGKITEHFAGKPARYWTMLLYILFSTTMRDYDALAANNELLMNLPIAVAVLLLLKKRFFWSGIFFGLGITFKYQAGFAAAALWIYLLWNRRWRDAVWLSLGAVLVGVVTAGWLIMHGAGRDLWIWGIRFNLSYVGQGLHGLPMLVRFLRRSLETVIPAGFVWLVGMVALWRKKNGLLSLWFLCSVLAMLPGGRFFGHYFLQPLAPLAVSAGLLAPSLWQYSCRWQRYTILASLVIPLMIFATLDFRRDQLLRIVNESEPDYRSVGQRIQEMTSSGDRIFVWANSPQIYTYAHRLPGTRFTFCNYQTGQSPATPLETDPDVETTPNQVSFAWEMLFDDLTKNRPMLFVDATHAGFDDFGKSPIEKFPRLASFLRQNYVLVDEVKKVRLYRRK